MSSPFFVKRSWCTALLFCILFVPLTTLSQKIEKSYLLGQFDESKDLRFVKLNDQFARGNAQGKYLRSEAYAAFVKMAAAAEKDGIKLFIVSATRNFEAQKRIWENKWSGRTLVQEKNLATISDLEQRAKLILLYSSMPGTSRHHWGTDMDINSVEPSYFERGEGLAVYSWLSAHAAEFGFCQPYTSKAAGRAGYEEEKWHWSYLPLSATLLKLYVKSIRYADIKGFDGSATAKSIQAIEKYVQGVGCK